MKRFLLTFALLALVAAPVRAAEIYRLGQTHVMAYSSSSRTITDAFNEFTSAVRITCSTACFWASAATGQQLGAVALSATSEGATSHYLPADVPVDVLIDGNGKIAVIRVSGDGTIYITEMSK